MNWIFAESKPYYLCDKRKYEIRWNRGGAGMGSIP